MSIQHHENFEHDEHDAGEILPDRDECAAEEDFGAEEVGE